MDKAALKLKLKNILLYLLRNILSYIRNSLAQYKFQYILILILPFWIMYSIYYTYYDETTKDAVIVETEHLANYIGDSPIIVYKNWDKLISFRAEIYIDKKDTDSINKCRKYLLDNGYKERRNHRWTKNKYEINEKYNEEFMIIKIDYIKDKLQ